jgi:hypothetical protein
MNYLLTSIVVAALSFTSWSISAEPIDSGPPAQTQKDNPPDSTKNGDYLEPQPDNNGATDSTTSTTEKNKMVKKHKNKDKSSKPTNMEKSKKVTEEPEEGGVELK